MAAAKAAKARLKGGLLSVLPFFRKLYASFFPFISLSASGALARHLFFHQMWVMVSDSTRGYGFEEVGLWVEGMV